MWQYEKKLEYPVNIKNPNPKLAKVIITQLGGPDGELGASLRYLNQRYVMPYSEVKGLLTDIGVSVTILHTYYYKRSRLIHRKGVSALICSLFYKTLNNADKVIELFIIDLL